MEVHATLEPEDMVMWHVDLRWYGGKEANSGSFRGNRCLYVLIPSRNDRLYISFSMLSKAHENETLVVQWAEHSQLIQRLSVLAWQLVAQVWESPHSSL